MSSKKDCYTNGLDIICIMNKQQAGYLVKDTENNTLILSNLKGYRRMDDNKSIKDWYKDSKNYIQKHPFSALLASLSVFFGLTNF